MLSFVRQILFAFNQPLFQRLLCDAMDIGHDNGSKRGICKSPTQTLFLLTLSINDSENVQATKVEKTERHPWRTYPAALLLVHLACSFRLVVRSSSQYGVRQNDHDDHSVSSPGSLFALSLAGNQNPDSFKLRSMPRFLAVSSTVRPRSFNTASSVSTTLRKLLAAPFSWVNRTMLRLHLRPCSNTVKGWAWKWTGFKWKSELAVSKNCLQTRSNTHNLYRPPYP